MSRDWVSCSDTLSRPSAQRVRETDRASAAVWGALGPGTARAMVSLIIALVLAFCLTRNRKQCVHYHHKDINPDDKHTHQRCEPKYIDLPHGERPLINMEQLDAGARHEGRTVDHVVLD